MAKVFYREVEEFEPTVINKLIQYKWDSKVLKNPTEEDLIENWRQILSFNNSSIDKLNGYPLTSSEMQQILAQVNEKHSAYSLNSFINGGSIQIKRDCEEDTLHYGKTVSLKIYDRNEIAGGKSIYQIAEQPHFKKQNALGRDRRGDLMLLINGMPVIHIELKKSGIPLSQATNQIQKYSQEGIFTGIFSLIQIFIAMTPDEVIYFANNPDSIGRFNDKYFFHWGDFYNRRVDDWEEFTRLFLHIPMAHELIGFYTIADKSDKNLKILRSYQYYAVNEIQNQVIKHDWEDKNQRGGLIWHTTGSGKTLTSFKCADLISKTDRADKVIFLVDRKNLDEQTYSNYVCFADTSSDVQNANSTYDLLYKLKSNDSFTRLIVCSIQKLSRLHDEGTIATLKDIEKINQKRLIFIVDECHRDTFGEMMNKIKRTFTHSLFFGFSGTPIFDTNSRDGSKTSDVFGSELHRYTIGDGIRDNNVLGFDTYRVDIYKEDEIRRVVAEQECKGKIEDLKARGDQQLIKKYYKIINEMNMLKVEEYLKSSQYKTEKYKNGVIDHILSKFDNISRNNKFHAIFATSSIPEAFEYYDILKSRKANLKFTVIVDKNEDNTAEDVLMGIDQTKGEKIAEIIRDYNNMYKMSFSWATYGDMKSDVSLRLAHKAPYTGISKNPDERLDLVIVVNQMLTGYDSKWVNVLYLDKILEQENLIQAISRTNRIFDEEKPFGLVYYYRKPYTMEQNMQDALDTYSGEKAYEVFVPKLIENIRRLNVIYTDIKGLFDSEGIEHFRYVPREDNNKKQFISLFNTLTRTVIKLRIQDFKWEQKEYYDEKADKNVTVLMSEEEYKILCIRYAELMKEIIRNKSDDTPFEIDTAITTIQVAKIDNDYMNARFDRFKKINFSKEKQEVIDKALTEVFACFKYLTEEEQRFAQMVISDVRNGELDVNNQNTLRDYITEYASREQNKTIKDFADTFGLNYELLKKLVSMNSENIADLNILKQGVDINKTIEYIKNKDGEILTPLKAKSKLDSLIREFIKTGGDSFKNKE